MLEVVLLKTPFEISFSGNPMPFIFAIAPYGEVEKTQDIRLQIRVLVENATGTGVYTEVRSQTFYPTGEGTIEFDVHSLIDPYLSYYLPRPGLQKAVQCPQQCRRYKLSYLLLKGADMVGLVTETEAFNAIKGGMAYEHWHPSNFFTQHITAEKNPLHFIIPGEKVAPGQPMFLFWIYPHPEPALQYVSVNIILSTGAVMQLLIDADETFIVDENGDSIIVGNENIITPPIGSGSITTSGGTKWMVWCKPIGFEQLGLNASLPAGAYPVNYTVEVKTTDTVIVAPITINLDHRQFYNTYDIFYRNSAGGLEALRLRGIVDMEADYSRQQAQRTVPPSYYQNLNLLGTTSQDSEEKLKFKGDTGFLGKAAANKLRDLFLSPQVHELEDGRLLPVVVNTKATKFYSNRDNLISSQVEWQRAFTNQFYTPRSIAPEALCPAVEKFEVKQLSKNMLQIMYALQTPYDQIEVEITAGATITTYTYTGNARVIRQSLAGQDAAEVTVRARTVCDVDGMPAPGYGPYTTEVLQVTTNSLPVANNDNFNIAAGFNTPVLLPGSVLDNDYDPDGDALESVATNGNTAQGGTYTISAGGVVTYKPPSSVFTGQDYFDYQVRELGGATTVTARVFINVGENIIPTVYVRLVPRDFGYNEAGNFGSSYAETWMDFFSDASGTQPLDVSAMNIIFDLQQTYTRAIGNSNLVEVSNTLIPRLGVGTKTKLSEGQTGYYSLNPSKAIYFYTFAILPGNGYTVI